MEKRKSNTFLYFVASVGLVIVAIIFTTLVDKVKSPETSEDIRARATNSSALKFTATVSSIDEVEGTLTVDNLQFADKGRSTTIKTLGSWKVTPPRNFRLSAVASGSRIMLSVIPTTFQTASHTFTASEITLNR